MKISCPFCDLPMTTTLGSVFSCDICLDAGTWIAYDMHTKTWLHNDDEYTPVVFQRLLKLKAFW